MGLLIEQQSRNFKGWIWSVFDNHVLPWLQPPFWWLYWCHMSYCTLSWFGRNGTNFCWHEWYKFLMACIHHAIQAHVWLNTKKANHIERNCLQSPATRKSGGSISLLHVWWQNGTKDRFPICNFLGSNPYIFCVLFVSPTEGVRIPQGRGSGSKSILNCSSLWKIFI